MDPPSGRIWTANARVVDETWLELLGDGGYTLATRARQIRDGLLRLDKATPEDMLAIQLDSYREFLQEGVAPGNRLDQGLHAAFHSVFPSSLLANM